jgi:RNase P/RNase MRP subunit p29
MFRKTLNAALISLLGVLVSVNGQTSPRPSVVTGDVVSVTESKIVLKTKDGDVDAVISASTDFKRVPPENPVLKAAVASQLSDISEGDKLLVTGVFGDDKKVLPARAVYLMSKSDIAQKNAKETERWATRGISGRVASVNPTTNQVTIEVRGLMNSTSVVVTPKGEAVFKRYKQDSVKYSEAVESSILDIKEGDMLRAVGDRGAEGTTFAAEEILTGAFQTVAGTVKSVDAEKGEVIVTQAGTNTDLTVAITSNSAVKRFPEEMAMRLAGGMFPGGAPGQGGARPAGGNPGGGQPTQGGGGQRPPGGAPGQGQGGPGGPGRTMMGGGARGGIDDMFERFPSIAIGDLKPGDVIAVSSSKNGNAQRVNAIKLLAGVEPFLRVAQMQAAAASAGQRGGQIQFSIPGLDGFDN